MTDRKAPQRILKELFPMEGSDGSYNLESDYRRIRMLNAFDMYFFDMLKGKLYHKDLSKLIANETEDDAIQLLTSMYEQDASSVVEYLRSRSMERLGTKDMLLRCMALLLALDHISRRNINVEVSFAWFLGLEAQKDAISAGIVKDPDEYRQLISDFIKEHTPTYTIPTKQMVKTTLSTSSNVSENPPIKKRKIPYIPVGAKQLIKNIDTGILAVSTHSINQL